jgi:hypothetical protein
MNLDYYIEKIPDLIIRNDLKYRHDFNYKHIFYEIGKGNIFYPECYLYENKTEINLYGGFNENGLFHRVKYDFEKQKYIFFSMDSEDEILNIFETTLWNEMYEYILRIFIYYIQ